MQKHSKLNYFPSPYISFLGKDKSQGGEGPCVISNWRHRYLRIVTCVVSYPKILCGGFYIGQTSNGQGT